MLAVPDGSCHSKKFALGQAKLSVLGLCSVVLTTVLSLLWHMGCLPLDREWSFREDMYHPCALGKTLSVSGDW